MSVRSVNCSNVYQVSAWLGCVSSAGAQYMQCMELESTRSLLNVQYDEMYKRSIEDPNGFWGDIAKEFYWEKQVQQLLRAVQCLHN